jgi:alkylation response protein AidB-like acyl-CoA dehydrogenase
MKGQRTEEVLELQRTLRRFIDEQMPRDAVEAWDKQNYFPRDVFERLARLGVMGVTVPQEYGGSGRDIPTAMMVIEELSKASMAIAIPFIMASCYAGVTLVECGSEDQKELLLPLVADGKMLFAYGWTEPDVGADLASVMTTAERDGDEVVINGAKRFCSGAAISDYIYTLVRSDPRAPRHHNLSLILIPPSAEGVTIDGIDAMGLKGAATTDVTFQDVRVPAANIVGGEEAWNNGWSLITGIGLDIEKLEVAAMALGLAQGAYDEAVAYSGQRRQFGRPIDQYQSVRHSLADMRTSLYAARLVLEDAAGRMQLQIPAGTETSMAKLFVTETARKVVLDCQTVLGAYGYVKGFECERFTRDILAMPIIGGSSAIQRNNISKGFGTER